MNDDERGTDPKSSRADSPNRHHRRSSHTTETKTLKTKAGYTYRNRAESPHIEAQDTRRSEKHSPTRSERRRNSSKEYPRRGRQQDKTYGKDSYLNDDGVAPRVASPESYHRSNDTRPDLPEPKRGRSTRRAVSSERRPKETTATHFPTLPEQGYYNVEYINADDGIPFPTNPKQRHSKTSPDDKAPGLNDKVGSHPAPRVVSPKPSVRKSAEKGKTSPVRPLSPRPEKLAAPPPPKFVLPPLWIQTFAESLVKEFKQGRYDISTIETEALFDKIQVQIAPLNTIEGVKTYKQDLKKLQAKVHNNLVANTAIDRARLAALEHGLQKKQTQLVARLLDWSELLTAGRKQNVEANVTEEEFENHCKDYLKENPLPKDARCQTDYGDQKTLTRAELTSLFLDSSRSAVRKYKGWE